MEKVLKKAPASAPQTQCTDDAIPLLKGCHVSILVNVESHGKPMCGTDPNSTLISYLTAACPLPIPQRASFADETYLKAYFPYDTQKVLLVEIISVLDIGKPLKKQQARIIDAEDISNDVCVDEVDDYHSNLIPEAGKGRRLTKFLMTDGCRYLVGIEYAPLSFSAELLQWQLENLVSGRKASSSVSIECNLASAILFNQPEIIGGVLFLQESNIKLLSSVVPGLCVGLPDMPEQGACTINCYSKTVENTHTEFLSPSIEEKKLSHNTTTRQYQEDVEFQSPTSISDDPFDDLVNPSFWSPSTLQAADPSIADLEKSTADVYNAQKTFDSHKSLCPTDAINMDDFNVDDFFENEKNRSAVSSTSSDSVEPINLKKPLTMPANAKNEFISAQQKANWTSIPPVTCLSCTEFYGVPWHCARVHSLEKYINDYNLCNSNWKSLTQSCRLPLIRDNLWNMRNEPMRSDKIFCVEVVRISDGAVMQLLVRADVHAVADTDKRAINVIELDAGPIKHTTPKALSQSFQIFHEMTTQTTGMYLVYLYDKPDSDQPSSKYNVPRKEVTSILLNQNIPRNIDQLLDAKPIHLDGEIISWSSYYYRWLT